MRRTILPAVTVAVLLVLPVAGFTQPVVSHGGTPGDVYMTSLSEPGVDSGTDPVACATAAAKSRSTLILEFTTAEESHVLVTFSNEWSMLGIRETGHMFFALYPSALTQGLFSPEVRTDGSRSGYTNGTFTWAFDNVPAGDQTLGVRVRVSSAGDVAPRAQATACSLTAVVMPVA